MSSINKKLNRVDESISNIREVLNLDASESIENITEATKLYNMANIFIQEEEPENKNGIWIQANKETYPYEKLIIDDDISAPDLWKGNYVQPIIANIYGSNIKIRIEHKHCVCIHKGKAYIVTESSYYSAVKDYRTFLIEVDLNTSIGSVILEMPSSMGIDIGGALISSGKDLYMVTNNNSATIFKVDIENKTYAAVGSFSRDRQSMAAYSAYDNCIYTLAGTGAFERFNCETNEYTLIKNGGSNWNTGMVIPCGSKLILCRNTTAGYATPSKILDIDNNYAEIAVSNEFKNFAISSYYPIIDLDNYLYIYGLGKKINKDTLEFSDFKPKYPTINLLGAGQIENKIIIFAGEDYSNNIYSYTSSYILTTNLNNFSSYSNNAICLIQKEFNKGTRYDISLISEDNNSSLQGSLKTGIYDAYYYSKEHGFNTNLPIYLGNGTE